MCRFSWAQCTTSCRKTPLLPMLSFVIIMNEAPGIIPFFCFLERFCEPERRKNLFLKSPALSEGVFRKLAHNTPKKVSVLIKRISDHPYLQDDSVAQSQSPGPAIHAEPCFTILCLCLKLADSALILTKTLSLLTATLEAVLKLVSLILPM